MCFESTFIVLQSVWITEVYNIKEGVDYYSVLYE